jgi:polyisoprenyl-phosphate glycosyltransferase
MKSDSILDAAHLPYPERNTETLLSVTLMLPRDQEEAADLETKLVSLAGTLRKSFEHFEILLLDNGCWPSVAAQADALLARIPNLRRLRLTRFYRAEIAITAALDHAIGDYVVLMDLASDPPELIAPLTALAASGFDAVVALPERGRETVADRLLIGPVYSLVSRILKFDLYPEDSYFRVFSRRLVNSIVKIRSKSRYLGCLNNLAGYQQCKVGYTPLRPRTAPGIRSSLHQIAAASNILVSNSATPLRFAAAIGILASLVNFAYLFYILAVTLVKQKIAEGWLTTSLSHTTMFIILFLILAIVAEYIVRVLDEAKEQPLYFVESEANSTVAVPEPSRLNVVR